MSKFDHRTSPQYQEIIKQAPKLKTRPHVGANELQELLPVLEALPDLVFPINSAGELLDALGRAQRMKILDFDVDPALLIKRMPAYYFPVSTYENFVEKMAELVRNNRRKIDTGSHTEKIRKKLPKLQFPIESPEQMARLVADIDSPFPLGNRKVKPTDVVTMLPKTFFPVRDQHDFERKAIQFIRSRPLIERD